LMPTQFLKTHYRRGASVLTPEQVEEIRCLKNKVPAYMIVRDYYINKNHVFDIWNNNERLQQSGEYVLADMLPKASSPSETDSKKKKTGGTKPKEKFKSKFICISELPVTQMPSLGPIQLFSMNLESSDINKEELCTSYEKIVEKNSEYEEYNSPIPLPTFGKKFIIACL
ncbi:24229_t:CDS:1, partial [Dentiscutata erythropus]